MSTAVPAPIHNATPCCRPCGRKLLGPEFEAGLCAPCQVRAAQQAAGLTVDQAVNHLWKYAEEATFGGAGKDLEIERTCPVTGAKVLYLGWPSQDARDHFAYQVARIILSNDAVRERVIADVARCGIRVAS